MKKYAIFVLIALISCEETEINNIENCLEDPIVSFELANDDNLTRLGSVQVDGMGMFRISVSGVPDTYDVKLSGPNGFYYSFSRNSGTFSTKVPAGSYGAYHLRIGCNRGCHSSSKTYYYSPEGGTSIYQGNPVPSKWKRCNHHSAPYVEAGKSWHFVEYTFGDPMVIFKLYMNFDGPIVLEVEEMGETNCQFIAHEKNRKNLNSGKVSRAFFYHKSSSSYFEAPMLIPDYFGSNEKRFRVRLYSIDYPDSGTYISKHPSECTNYVVGDFYLAHKGYSSYPIEKSTSFRLGTIINAVPYYGDF